MDTISTEQKQKTHFLVTSQGLAATRWIAYVLASDPSVFVCHGHHPIAPLTSGDYQKEKKDDQSSFDQGALLQDLYDSSSLEDLFGFFEKAKPEAQAVGNVHGFTCHEFISAMAKNPPKVPIRIHNVVRHPITYIDSHTALVIKTKNHSNPALYQHDIQLYEQARVAYPLLSILGRDQDPEFLAFVVSCLSVENMALDFRNPQIPHVPMEQLTTDPLALKSFCEGVTGLLYEESVLRKMIEDGPLNRHRSQTAVSDPQVLFNEWPEWKQFLAKWLVSKQTLEWFEKVGYDVSMLTPIEASDLSEAQKEELKESIARIFNISADEIQDAMLVQDYVPRLIEEGYYGFNIVRFNRHYHAIAQTLGELDLFSASTQKMGKYSYMKEERWDTLRDSVHKSVPLLREENFLGFNVVEFNGELMAVAQDLGTMDLRTLEEDQIKQLSQQGKLFKSMTTEELQGEIISFRASGLRRQIGQLESTWKASQQDLIVRLRRQIGQLESTWEESQQDLLLKMEQQSAELEKSQHIVSSLQKEVDWLKLPAWRRLLMRLKQALFKEQSQQSKKINQAGKE